MDLRQLKYFIAAAEEKNIGRAATKLCISQPPLTRQIKQLEGQLNVKLLDRTSRGVELTDAGALFLEEARNILSLVEQTTERVKRAGAGQLGRLDVAIFGSGILNTIPKILLAFKHAYPDVKVVLHTMEKDEQVEALRQRRISLSFNRLLPPLAGLTTEVVRMEKLLLAVNKKSPLSKLSSVPFHTLQQNPLILVPTGSRPNFVDKVIQLTQENNIIPNITQIVGDAVTGVALVASGFGVCIVPESATVLSLPGVVYRPLSGLPESAKVDLSCIYRSGDESPLLAAFLGTMREIKDSL